MSDHYTSRNRISLVYSGEDYFSLLIKMIETAKYTIHLQMYIYDNDETGRRVGDALKSAVTRGVAVFLHVDGYASQRLSKGFRNEMLGAGVQFKFFEPLLRSTHFYFGRRLHQKVVVADGLYSLVGGLNISNRYNDMPGMRAWFDLALYCEGEASYHLHLLCKRMWKRKKIRDKIRKENVEEFCQTISPEERQLVRVRQNDWVKRKSEIWNTYKRIFAESKDTITVMSSYFLPGRTYRILLSRAKKRGVKVKVILMGKSDIPISKNAERFLYDWLIKKEIEIYEYQPTVMHAKVTVCDSHFVTIGSFNVNNISAYASLELNLDIKDKSFGSFMEAELNKIITENCIRIIPENYKRSTNIFKKLWQKICYSLVNAILTLFTFYFKQEE